MNVRDLLNPMSSGESQPAPPLAMQVPPQPPPAPRPKPRKDEPTLRLHAAQGVEFAPFDRISDPRILQELQRWNIWPSLAEIGRYCDHIPYHSDKKNFGNVTGRGAFEGLSSAPSEVASDGGSVRIQVRVPGISSAGKRTVLGHLGLPSRPRADHPLLQGPRPPKGGHFPCPVVV
jgi:hypothetical protein